MPEPTYLEELAARVSWAWTEDLHRLRSAVAGLLAGWNRLLDETFAEQQDGTSRDRLQEALAHVLFPPPDLECRPRKKAIDEIASLAAKMTSLQAKGWENHVRLLQKKCGRENPVELKTMEEWESFLNKSGPSKETPSTERQRITGISVNALHETVFLLRSFAPVVARGTAARLTTKPRLKKIFLSYGFVTSQENIEEGLAKFLSGKELPRESEKKDLAKWPNVFAGSFASELATVVEYPPSVWMLERELRSIDRASDARKGKKSDAPTGGSAAKPGVSGSDAGTGNKFDHPRDRAWGKGLMGLCFSGGGIRSATFNLGVLQGLARRGMLPHFHYLSTVSGGGYIGSWLISWIKRAGMNTNEVAARLSPGIVPDPADPLLRPIEFLRKFSNYLTPKTGLFSVDTWVLGVVWLRNTLLNLLILLPALLAVLFLPRLLEISAFHIRNAPSSFPPFLPCVQLAIVVWVISLIAINLRDQDGPRPESTGWYARPWWIRNLIVLPLFPVAWGLALALGLRANSLGKWQYETIALLGAALALVILVVIRYPQNFKANASRPGPALFWVVVAMISIPLAFGGAGLLTALGLKSVFSNWLRIEHEVAAVTVWGAPLVILAIFLLIVLLMGLVGRNLPITATIWLGRLKTHMVMYGVIWVVWVGIAMYGPWISNQLWTKGHGWIKLPAIAAWAWTTLKSVLAGNDARSSTPKPGDWKTMSGFYLTVGPYVFILGLMLALSSVARIAFQGLGNYLPSSHFQWLKAHPWMWGTLIGFGLSIGLAWLLSFCIDVNEFSMNTFYRTRLARCYLGATNDKRRPMPFTGYDPDDDSNSLASFMNDGQENHYDGPYPIFNGTLNLVHGEELAWQERKGASFVFTPDLCGYETPWDSTTDPHAFRNLHFVGYRETKDYAYRPVGMHLATPMSISGAAVSPNMGFFSGAATAFLMTLFNVRLGWWLGNPRHKKTWKKGGPTQGLAYLVKELLGLTDDRAGFVYISDGGHFENLAIYELVRRRCRYIVACDAEEDENFSFQGLGNAIRKCREDFGVEIDINVDQIKPDPKTGRSRAHCAVGKVYYPDQPGWGYLVYLKASLVGDEPEDVLEYRVKHSAFPHQSTADQWFTESQFESYRRLGLHIAKTAFRHDGKEPLDDDEGRNLFFARVWERWYPPSEALEKNFTRHAAAYDALVRELRSDPELRWLDDDLFTQPGGQPAATPGVSVIHDPEKEFLFLTSLFQLMENVYIDLDLENNADHPNNAGWMSIFSKWTQTVSFRNAWQRCDWTYGRNFQNFCNRLFGIANNH
jgi:hypothetical protein